MSDYIGNGEKLMKLVDYTLSLHSNTITVPEAQELLQAERWTIIRLFKRLDLMAYEFHNFGIHVNYKNGGGASMESITIRRK